MRRALLLFSLVLLSPYFAWASGPEGDESSTEAEEVDTSCTSAPETPAARPCMRFAKNFIRGDVLYVEGEVDSMLYNLLKAEGLENTVKRIELNSPGGSLEIDYPYLIADIIREKGMITSVRDGAACGSSCVMLYQAGAKRVAHKNAHLVFHGVQVAFAETDYLVGCLGVGPRGKKGSPAVCAALKEKWYQESRVRTDRIFAYLEAHGATAQLYLDLQAQPKDEDWLDRHNIFGVQDWWLPAPDAVAYGMVQEIED